MRRFAFVTAALAAALAWQGAARGQFPSPQSPPLPTKAPPFKAAPSPQFRAPAPAPPQQTGSYLAPAPYPAQPYYAAAEEEEAEAVIVRSAPVVRYRTVYVETQAPDVAPATYSPGCASVQPVGGYGRGFGRGFGNPGFGGGAGVCNPGFGAGFNNPGFGGYGNPGFGAGFNNPGYGGFNSSGAAPAFSGGGVQINARKIKKSFQGGLPGGGGPVIINARKIKKSF